MSFSEWLDIGIKFTTLFGAILVFFTKHINYKDAIKASEFYGIPVEYFIDNSLSSSLAYRIFIVFFPFFIIILPALIQMFFNITSLFKYDAIYLSFIICVVLVLLLLGKILDRVNKWLDKFSEPRKIIIYVISNLSMIGIITYLYYKYIVSEIFEIKEAKFNPFNFSVGTILVTILVLLLAGIIIYSHIKKEDLKRKYDYYDEKRYEIILQSSRKGKVPVDIIIIRNDEEAVTIKGYVENKELTIYKGEYRIEDISNKNIINMKFDNVKYKTSIIEDIKKRYAVDYEQKKKKVEDHHESSKK